MEGTEGYEENLLYRLSEENYVASWGPKSKHQRLEQTRDASPTASETLGVSRYVRAS